VILGLRNFAGHTPGTLIRILRTLVGGFFMGSADLVPGVSGGTIALVIGIYERLVRSIREGSAALGSLLKGDRRSFQERLREVEWSLLLPLLAGILLAIYTLAGILEHQLETNPEIMAGAFFGLVVGSVLIAWRLLKFPRIEHVVVALIVAALVFWVLGLGEEATVSDPSLVVFFGSGALAICAMILPGISGSLILLLIGMYPAVLGAVNDRGYTEIGIFALGAIIGLAFFSQLLNWALREHHDVVLAGLVGLMAGSLRVVWPWPDGVDSSELGGPQGDLGPVTLATLVGLVAVFVISRVASTRGHERIEPLERL